MNNYSSIDHLLFQNKEKEPVFLTKNLSTNENNLHILKTKEHRHHSDLNQYIESRPEILKLSSDLEKSGLSSNDASQFTSTEKILKVKMTDEEIFTKARGHTDESGTWLANLGKYLIEKTGKVLGSLNGKVIRRDRTH